jgi:hypothetical protein
MPRKNRHQRRAPTAATPSDLRLYYINRASPRFNTSIVTGSIQNYFPSLEVLFPSLETSTEADGYEPSRYAKKSEDQVVTTPALAAAELAVSVDVSDGIATAEVENLLTHARRQVPVWIRPVHLVEPLNVLEGEYVLPVDGALPAPRGPWQRALRKINDPNNEAYTDAVFACMASRLVETGRSPHWCRFYGTVNGRAPTYTYNITDEMEDIENEDWFINGMASKAFKVVMVDPYDPAMRITLDRGCIGPRAAGRLIDGDASSEELSDNESVLDHSEKEVEKMEEIGELEEADIELSTEVAEITRPRQHVRLSRHSSSGSGSNSGSRSGSGSSSDSDDAYEYQCLIPNFPVQLTMLERCDGTLDGLMEDDADEDAPADLRNTKEERWTAWLFQVIAALSTAQQHYDFVHNDLHTNNVMWCGTGETHLYYHVQGAVGGDRYYSVPTYGRIMKIIDFGRATFRPSAASTENKLWIPDAYAEEGDAAGQYNCGPYFVEGKPKVQPNKSFDLCRLAVSIIDTLWEEEPVAAEPRKVLTRETGHVQSETVSPLWNLLWQWLTDKEGRNVLRGPDGKDRYPRFDLYCAIASDVTNAVPAQQLTLPLFDSVFCCRREDIPVDAHIWKLTAAHKT